MSTVKIRTINSPESAWFDISHLIAHNGYGHSLIRTVNETVDIQGNLNVDVISEKNQISCTFRPMQQAELRSILDVIQDYVVEVEFLSPYGDEMSKMTAYCAESKFDYYHVDNTDKLLNGFSLTFTECRL